MIDFRQRLEQSRTNYVSSAAPIESEENIECPFFGTNRGKNLVCLDVRLPQGVRKAVSYAYFMEINFNIEKGIEILTTQKRIRILGRNLSKLFDYLIEYKVRFVEANKGVDVEEDGLFVKEIFVEDL